MPLYPIFSRLHVSDFTISFHLRQWLRFMLWFPQNDAVICFPNPLLYFVFSYKIVAKLRATRDLSLGFRHFSAALRYSLVLAKQSESHANSIGTATNLLDL